MFVKISSGIPSNVGGADILLRSMLFDSYTNDLCRGFPRSRPLWFGKKKVYRSKEMVDVEGESGRCYMMDVLATSDS
jgi:hypothetical protein